MRILRVKVYRGGRIIVWPSSPPSNSSRPRLIPIPSSSVPRRENVERILMLMLLPVHHHVILASSMQRRHTGDGRAVGAQNGSRGSTSHAGCGRICSGGGRILESIDQAFEGSIRSAVERSNMHRRLVSTAALDAADSRWWRPARGNEASEKTGRAREGEVVGDGIEEKAGASRRLQVARVRKTKELPASSALLVSRA
ncbi:hypothetical protein C8R45DRAFT_401240 [Mycena sanguinolenta]|nr:hypothetical protein C8R45DRAFT_401240 [Mycena sanguinolenta]